MNLRKSLLLLFLMTCFALYGQQYNLLRFNNYSVENGLSATTVFDIRQTTDGYLWFGTADGLNRFDGYSFRSFKHRHSDPLSIPENYVTGIEAAANGSLWVGCNNGQVCLYDPITDHFTRPKPLESFGNNSSPVQFIRYDQNKNLWISWKNGVLIRWNEAGGSKPELIRLPEGVSALSIYSVTDNIYLGSTAGLLKLKTGKNEQPELLYSNAAVNQVIGYGQEGLLLATDNGPCFSPDGKHFISLLPDIEAQCMTIQHRDGYVWAGMMYSGLLRFRIQDNATADLSIYSNDPLNNQSLINNFILSSYADPRGNIWFGTISGLSAYFPKVQQIGLYRRNPADRYSLSDNNIYSIYEDPSRNLWISTLDKGLNLLNRETGEYRVFQTDNCSGLENNSIRSIFCDSKGRYWCGVSGQGFCSFNPGSRTFRTVSGKPGKGISSATIIRKITEDWNGMLWIGTDNGLNSYDPVADTFHFYPAIPGQNEQAAIYDILPLKDKKRLLVATFGDGLQLLNPLTGKSLVYKGDVKNSFSISNNNVLCIHRISGDSFLLGTYGGGINLFNLRTGIFRSFTIENGLSSDMVYGILQGAGRQFWLSTNRGISRFDLKNASFLNYDQLSQVQSLEFNEGAYAKDFHGLLYFGGINGINVIDPDKIRPDTFHPPLIISGLRIFGKDFPFRKYIYGNNTLELNYNQNFIQIDYTGLSFVNSNKLQYRYMLEGFDDGWVNAGNNRTATYTNVPPGEYQFLVVVSNDDGIWNNEPLRMSIVIRAPFWKTAWFYLLLVVFGIGTIWLVVFLRTRIIRRNFNLALAETELKALRSQMNPHFIFNSINSIQYFILNKDKKEAYSYLTKFSALMRSILQNSRQNLISLSDELEALKLYIDLEKLRLDGNLDFRIELKDFATDQIRIPSMIIQPYVENAILHGLNPSNRERKLLLHFRTEDNYLVAVIEDNGIGRAAAEKMRNKRIRTHESTAIHNTKLRLEMLNRESGGNASAEIEDLYHPGGEAAGTRVTLKIPIC